MRSWLFPVVVACVVALAAPSHAAPSHADRLRARKLAGEASDLFSAGDYVPALDKFVAADELVAAPTLKLQVARCLDKLDRMKEAADMYRQVIAYELKRFDKAVYRKARSSAVAELSTLLEQLPSVIVTVEATGLGAEPVTTINGEPFQQVGERQQLDPGFYVFETKDGDWVATEELELKRGASERVQLVLSSPEVDVPPPPPTSASTDALWVAGWVAVGVGAAGLIVGAATGGAVLAKQSGLEERCPDRKCPPDAHEDARAFDTLRFTSTAGLIVAGVGGAVGTTLLLIATSEDDEASAGAVEPLIGFATAGVRVRF